MPAETIGAWRPRKRPQPTIGADRNPFPATGGDQWPDDGSGVVDPSDWAGAFQQALGKRPSLPMGGFGGDNPLTRGGGLLQGNGLPSFPKPKPSPLKAIQQAILRGGADTGYNPIGSVLPAPGELPGHSPNDAEPDADGDDGGLERIKQLLLNTVPQGGLDAAGPKFDPATPEPSFVGPERPAQPHRSRWGALGQAILRGTRAAFQH